MFKYLIITIAIIFGALFSMNFWIATPKIFRGSLPEAGIPHLYKNPDKNIDKIKIFVFYFVPQDKKQKIIVEGWQEIIEKNLKILQKFHSLQFQGRSKIVYKIYPKAVVGLRDSLDYDTAVTQYGNPRALISISEELEKRVFKKDGDLFLSDFFGISSDEYPVTGILYEGVGSIGGTIHESDSSKNRKDIEKEFGLLGSVIFDVDVDLTQGFFLLSRLFLTDQQYADFGATLFAHEFYHTLGIPDAYENFPKDKPVSQDIMGLGRERPINKTYISRSTLKDLGF